MNPPTTTGTRHDRRRARTRAAILDAAERAFTRSGYGGARIEAIADEADVAVGSIYGHFGNKDGLWSALAERALEQFESYLERAYVEDWSPLEQVVACGDAYLRFHAEHPGSFRFLAFDGSQMHLPIADEALQQRVTERLASIIDRFESVIAAGVQRGEIRDVDTRLMARFLWAAWNGTVALTVRSDELVLSERELHDCLEQARAMVLEGLCAPGLRDAQGRAPQRLLRVSDG